MPEQPADPLHYEMKIPPEPKHEKARNKADKAESGEKAPQSDMPGDSSADGDQDKPYTDRRPG